RTLTLMATMNWTTTFFTSSYTSMPMPSFFFYNSTPTTTIYTLSLHDALPIYREFRGGTDKLSARFFFSDSESFLPFGAGDLQESLGSTLASSISSDRKSTRLNSSHDQISYAVFCLKKKKQLI